MRFVVIIEDIIVNLLDFQIKIIVKLHNSEILRVKLNNISSVACQFASYTIIMCTFKANIVNINFSIKTKTIAFKIIITESIIITKPLEVSITIIINRIIKTIVDE